MMRELSAVFAALWVLLLLAQIPGMAGGPEAHSMWLGGVRSVGWVVFSLVSLLFVLYHAWTAFTSTDTLVFIRRGKQPISGRSLNAAMFLGWAVTTLVIAFVLVSPGIGG
jgi:fumarate reductase subunit C